MPAALATLAMAAFYLRDTAQGNQQHARLVACLKRSSEIFDGEFRVFSQFAGYGMLNVHP